MFLDNRRERNIREAIDRRRDVIAGRVHRDILVAVKVDAAWPVAAAKQLLLQPLVARHRLGPILGRLWAAAAATASAVVATSTMASTTAAVIASAVVAAAVIATAVVASVIMVVIRRLLPTVVSGQRSAAASATVTVTPAAAAADKRTF